MNSLDESEKSKEQLKLWLERNIVISDDVCVSRVRLYSVLLKELIHVPQKFTTIHIVKIVSQNLTSRVKSFVVSTSSSATSFDKLFSKTYMVFNNYLLPHK